MRSIVDEVFPLAEYQARLDRVRLAMVRDRLDVLVVSSPENICYICGYELAGYFASQALLVTTSMEPVLVVRELEIPNATASCICDCVIGYRDHENSSSAIAREVRNLGVAQGRIGVDLTSRWMSCAQLDMLRTELSEAQFGNAFGIVERLRLRKSELELSYIRTAGRISEQAMKICIEVAHRGRRERDIAADVYSALISAGSDWIGAPFFIASGPRSARAHTTWCDRPLGAGDPVFVEVNASVRRYHAAIMRSLCIAPADPRYRSMCEASCAGLEAALAIIRPGVIAAEVDRTCRDAIRRAGWGEAFRLRTGYSVGLGFENFGEGYLFSLHEANDAALESGMVLHIVPYLAEAGFAGCAFSETLIVTENGAELVSKVSRELVIS